MPDVTSTTSCTTKYPPIIGERLILDDLLDYLKGTPDGAVKDALMKGRTNFAGKLLGIGSYRERRKLAKFAELKKALDTRISADPTLKKAYEYFAKLLTNPQNNTDLFAALKSLDDANPADSPAKRIIRERLIFEDFEQYVKNQSPDADKRIDTLQRTIRLRARQMNSRKLRAFRADYKRFAANMFLKGSYMDLQATLCQLDPCKSSCPAISSVTPQQVQPGQETTLVIKGRNFPKNPKVSLSPNQGIQVLKVKRTSAENVEIKIKAGPKAATGQISIQISSLGDLFAARSTFEIPDPCAKITNNLLRAGCCENNPEATSCKKGGE